MTRLASENFDFWPIPTPTVGTVEEDPDGGPWPGWGAGDFPSGGFNIVEPVLTPAVDETLYYCIPIEVKGALPSVTTAPLRLLDATGTVLEISILSSGVIRIFNQVTKTLLTGTDVVKPDEWNFVEIALRIASSGNGKVSWRFNGVDKVIDQEMDFRNLGILRPRGGNPGATASGVTTALGRIAINNDQGTTDNTWVGLEPDPIPLQSNRYLGWFIAENSEATEGIEKAPFDLADKLWDELEGDIGKPVAVLHYGDPWGADGPEWDGFFFGGRTSEYVHERGAIAMKDLGGPAGVIQLINEGDKPTIDGIRDWARKARAYRHPMFLRLWWEMNGTWFNWSRSQCTGTEYVEAWRTFVDIIREEGATNVTLIWCPNALFKGHTNPFGDEEAGSGNFYPGDDYVDWTGADGYTGQNPNKLLGWRTSKEVLGETYELMQEKCPTKPFAICETSASEWFTKEAPAPPHKADWLRQLLQLTVALEMPNCLMVDIFNWRIFENGGYIDWPIQTSPSAIEAVRESLEDPHWVDPGVRHFSDLVPVPLPGYKPRAVAVRQEYPQERISVHVETPSGVKERWADDAPLVENVASDIRLVDEMNGGDKELTLTLPRDPARSYPDLEPYSIITARSYTGEIIWGPGQLDKVSEVDGAEQKIEVAAIGYQAALQDQEGTRFGLINSDMSRWTDSMSTAAKEAIYELGIGLSAAIALGFSSKDVEQAIAAIVDDFTAVQRSGERDDAGIAVFDSGGIDLGQVLYDFRQISSFPTNPDWETRMMLGTDDTFAVNEPGTDHDGDEVHRVQQEVSVSSPGYRFARLIDRYAGSFTGQMSNAFAWENLRVLSLLALENLELRGDWPEIGYTAEQILRLAVPLLAPPLEVTDESIEDDDYLIRQAWWDGAGATVAAIVEDVSRFSPTLRWYCKGRVFHRRFPGEGARLWKAYAGPANLRGAGADAQRVWESVTVQWQDVDGTTKTAGPPGSGADFEVEGLTVTDPNNAAVKSPRTREKVLTLRSVSELAPAIAAGEGFLTDVNRLDNSGECTLQGYVMDEFGGLYPVSHVRGWDLVSFIDRHDKSYHSLTSRDYSDEQQALTISLDAPADNEEALLERYEADIQTLNLAA